MLPRTLLRLLLLAGATARSAVPVDVRTTVNVADPVDNAAQTLIGVELEAVGHGIVGGGLSSQMIFDGSFEDPKDAGATPAHWRFTGGGVDHAAPAFNGNASARLAVAQGAQGTARAESSGLYRRGLSLKRGKTYAGWVALRCSVGAVVRAGLAPGSGAPLAPSAPLACGEEWALANFSLAWDAPTTNRGAWAVELTGGASAAWASVDVIFVECVDELWRGMHVRSDVADALTLGGKLQSIRLDGTSGSCAAVKQPNQRYYDTAVDSTAIRCCNGG